MRNLRQLIRRSGLLPSDQRRRRSEKLRRGEATRRRLGNEVLERRELLAGDMILAANHNYWNPYDVNDDGAITARDALGVINYLSRAGEGEAITAANLEMFYDVNADNNISAADALGVINAISRGEEVGELVELLLTARDLNDQPITPDGDGEINVEVGQVFNLEVAYDDLRLFNNRLGVFQLFTDIAVSQPNVLVPVLNETQRLIIDGTILSIGSTSVNFSIPQAPPGVSGGSLSYVSSIDDFGNDTIGEVGNALLAFGYTADQFDISSLDFGNDDLGFQIHWTGNEFGNIDLPNISVDVIESNPAETIPTQTVEFAPFEADGVTPNGEAVRFNVDSFSRTFNQNEQFYSSQNRGTFSLATGFTGVGGLGMVPTEGGGIPQLTDDGKFIEPFDAFSLRVFLKSAVTGLEVSVNPGEDPEATLLYGRDDAVPQDMVLIENVDTNSNGVARVIINAAGDTAGVLSIAADLASVDEDAGVARFTVTRTGGSSGAISVDFETADVSATAGADYTATSGTLDFNDGELSKTIEVPILDDNVENEPNESFTLTLLNPAGGATLGTSVASVVIVDNDIVLPGVLAFSVSSQDVNEDAGTVTLTVNRTGGSDGEVTVEYATQDGTAIAGEDYTAGAGTLTFIDGQTQQTIEIEITEDLEVEAIENFVVTLSQPGGGASLGAIASVTVNIIEDDLPGELSFEFAQREVNEDGSQITLTVLRTSGSDGEVSVEFDTVDGTAVAGEDYVGQSGTLIFPAGVVSQTITIDITDDSNVEPNEVFTVALSNPTGGASLGANSSVAVTILEDDVPGVLAFDVEAAEVNEADGTVTLKVNRTNGSDGEVSVDFTTSDGTAVAGQDYSFQEGTLTFASGITTADIVIQITDDTLIEADETFTVTLSSPGGGASLGANSVATVTILENDIAVAFEVGSVEVDEDAGTVTVNVLRTGDSDAAVSVDFATQNGTAEAGLDYVASNGTLNFAATVTSQPVTISISDDKLDELNETFLIQLSNASTGTVLGTNDTVTVTIVDDDVPGVLSIQSTATVNERAGTVSLTVTRSNGSDGEVTVQFATIDGTAQAGLDYTADSGVLTFGDGQTTQTIEIAITDDVLGSEPSEVFVVQLSDATGGATIGTASATVTIENVNDAPTISGPVVVATRSEQDASFTVDQTELLSTASDREGDTLSVTNLTLVSGDNRGVTISGDSLLVNPAAYGSLTDSQSAVATYSYLISDGVNTPIAQMVTVTINGFNDPPVARDDTGAVTFTGVTVNVNVLGNDDAGDGESQTLTVESATSNDGTVAILANGTINFTPNPNFLGGATVEYTLRDEQGKTDTATVFITVQDFRPSSISGSVFVDHVENLQDVLKGADPIRNGIQDSDEGGLGGSTVRLVSAASDNQTGAAIELTVLTNLDGSFTFGELAPGTYHVVYDHPNTVIYLGVSDKVVEIEESGEDDVTGVNFGVIGTQGAALNNVDILASSYLRTNATINQISNGGREGGLVSLDAEGNQEFVIAFSGFEDVRFAEFALSNDRDTALLTVIEENGNVMSAILSSDHFVVTADGRAVQFFGGMNDLSFFDPESVASIQNDFPSYRDAIDQVLADL